MERILEVKGQKNKRKKGCVLGRTEGIIFKRVEGWLKLLYKKSEGGNG